MTTTTGQYETAKALVRLAEENSALRSEVDRLRVRVAEYRTEENRLNQFAAEQVRRADAAKGGCEVSFNPPNWEDHIDLERENAVLRVEVERLNRKLTESNQAFAVLDGVRTRAESRAEVAEADVERLDWLDGRSREIETGLWQWSIWHNRPVGVRAAIDEVKGGKP
jgi:regulator of replication initiation timing